jgi:hypothetical protein
MTLLYICGTPFLLGLVAWVIEEALSARRIQKARDQYYELQKVHLYNARDYCPHRFISLSQTDAGVMTMTDKWCKICGKHLGPAKLKKSIFGNKWI